MQLFAWKLLLGSLLGTCLQACTCGKLFERAEFTAAKLTPNGKTGLFVAMREYHYGGEYTSDQCEQQAHRHDRWLIGAYDMQSEKISVLHRFDHRTNKWFRNAGWTIESITNSKVLMRESGELIPQSKTRYKSIYYWLDLYSNQLAPLPLTDEIVKRELSPQTAFQLLDEAGTLLLRMTPLKKLTLNTSETELWVCHPERSYERLGVTSDTAVSGDDVYFWDLQSRKGMVYHPKTRSLRSLNDKQYQILRRERELPPVSFSLGSGQDSHQLQRGQKQGHRWQYRVLPITVNDLDQN